MAQKIAKKQRPTRYRASDLLPAEAQLREFIAKQQLKAAKASLSIHAAADKGRRNRDWRANPGSADLAIIPDSETLNARSRQLVRDSWMGKSIARAYSRNIVGKGISTVPHAKDADGKPLVKLNRKAKEEFDRWAKAKEVCDVEKKQTWPQKQQLSVSERATVGEHFIIWSYETPVRRDGSVDLSKPVGLRLQSFEPEQLDLRILSFEGREVRGGIELDENGAAVAYHFYTRNPNDYLYRKAFWSKRVPRERVFHYFRQERVLQTRGVTPLAPVMLDIKDYARYREATIWRAVMEACIGLIIKKPYPSVVPSPLTLPNTGGELGNSDPTSLTGVPLADMYPGMVANLQQGEEVDTLSPTTPGNMFDPFTSATERGIGAGVGMSHGQLTRRSQGNYSVARQDMLEDRKEWEPEQELLIDDECRPVYCLWFNFAVLEGRFDKIDEFDAMEFRDEPHRFTDADYIPPPQTWIDPEKEANAFAVLLKNRLITREEIIALRGQRFSNVVNKLASEKDLIDGLGMTLPEDAQDRTELRDLIKGYMAEKSGAVAVQIANQTDEEELLGSVGVPVRKGQTQANIPMPNPAVLPKTPATNPLSIADGAATKGSSALANVASLYSEDQPRDADGKFGSGGGGLTKSSNAPKSRNSSPAMQTPTAATKSAIAKQTSRYVGADVQRYSEEHNEQAFAKAIGGMSLRDNEPVDVIIASGGVITDGVELKTMTDNKQNKIYMKKDAMLRKSEWMRKNHADFHTVVLDDEKVFNANGPGKHGDLKDRGIYYKRGFGSFRVNAMHKCANYSELKTLMSAPTKSLPRDAMPSTKYPTVKPRKT